MDTNKVILEVIKSVASGKGADEKIAVLEAIIAENRHASESEIEILESANGKPKKKKD
jgi:hypothetical protein